MSTRNPETRKWIAFAANLVKQSVHEGPDSISHKLAYGRPGGHTDAEDFGIVGLWLKPRTIAAIRRNELNRIGTKLGFPPVHASPRR